jgi:hypothetical protein
MKKVSIAAMVVLLSLGATNITMAGPRLGDDTNRFDNKSTGG